MDCNTPGFPVHHQLLQFDSNFCPLRRWCHPTISSSVIPFSCLQPFPASGAFPVSQFFESGGQNIGVSASASVLPMNIQDWTPLGWTHWISSQSKGLSRVFSNATVQKHQFFTLSFLYSPTLTSIHDYCLLSLPISKSYSPVWILLMSKLWTETAQGKELLEMSFPGLDTYGSGGDIGVVMLLPVVVISWQQIIWHRKQNAESLSTFLETGWKFTFAMFRNPCNEERINPMIKETVRYALGWSRL